MKKSLLIASVFASQALFAQSFESDSVSIQGGYANQGYYSLENGEVANIDNSDWDLAFSTGGGSSTIRTNTAKGTQIWLYPNGDTSAWNTIDTSGITTWEELGNSIETWTLGSFSEPANSSDPFDLGWGAYNMTTHHVNGNRIFIVKSISGTYKKVIIESLVSGLYTVHLADLNGQNDAYIYLDKDMYGTKNFGYYSIDNDSQDDREPASAGWDLLFTQYAEPIDMGGSVLLYPVSGVLVNEGVELIELTDLADPFADQDTTGATFSTDISTIGRDWKAYDMNAGGYVLDDSLAFLVKNIEGDVYQVVFTGFESGDGKFVFSKKLLYQDPNGVTGIENNAFVNVFPNPANNIINIAFDVQSTETLSLSFYDLSGKQVLNKQTAISGFDKETVDVSTLPSGIYFLNLRSESIQQTQKIIIK